MYAYCFICRKEIKPFDWSPGYVIDCKFCGNYKPSEKLLRLVVDRPVNNRHIYSGAIRELYEESGREVWVENLDILLASVVVPKNPMEKIDRILLHIAKNSMTVDTGVPYDFSLFPIAYAQTENELGAFISMAANQAGYLTVGGIGDPILLTMAGWRRVEELATVRRSSSQAFVAMSFKDDLTEVWTDAFYPALNQVGYDPLRVDTTPTNHKIDNKIVADIRKSGLVVADFTGQSNGVYFEAGFAEGLGIDVIYSVQETDITNLHFDTRQYNHIVWKDLSDLKKQLIDRIEATLPNRPRLSKEHWKPLS